MVTRGEALGCHALGMGQPASRRQRLFDAASEHGVPLRTILVVDAVAVGTIVLAYLVMKLREVILLVVIASFIAIILEPAVGMIERRGARRGLAAGIVFSAGLLCFGGLAFLFGYPLVRGLTHFAEALPRIVNQAAHGKGRIGRLIARYHLQAKVKAYEPKLVAEARNLSRPALSLGKATVSAVVAGATVVVLTLLVMLEAPRIAGGIMRSLSPERASFLSRVSREVSRSVTGYMLGNVLTSLMAGLVIFVDLVLLGVPFALLLSLWVALVDLLPLVGGLLAGVVVVVIAVVHSLVAGVITLAVFLVYQQVENHVLSPIVMSRTVRINPLLVLLAVLMGANLGDLAGSTFGGFAGALLAIPVAGALQVLVKELWRSTGNDAEEGPAAVSN
jgi:predicted PurR-regulated permease PerM